MDPSQKRIHFGAGPDGFSSQVAYYETKIRQEIIFRLKRFGHVYLTRVYTGL